MAQSLDALVSAENPKQFTSQFQEIEKSYPDVEPFLADLVDQVAPRLYDPFYDENPRGFYGITCASLTEQLFPFERGWRPYAQQVWALTRERKRIPYSDQTGEPRQRGEGGLRLQDLQDAVRQQDVAAILQATRDLREESRDQLRAKLMMLALEDAALGGHKLNYLCQSWLLAERLSFRNAAKALFGALHLLARSPRDEGLAVLAGTPPLSPAASAERIDEEAAKEVRRTILHGSNTEARDAVAPLLEWVSREEMNDLLRLTAAQAIANARRGPWLAPVRAFHTVFLTTEYLDWFEEQERARALLLLALLVNRVSSRTGEGPSDRQLDEMAKAFCPTDPFAVLRNVISRSDPFAAATATYSILGMDSGKREELFQTLMGQAVKNNGEICWGHDILLVAEARRCYCHSRNENRSLFAAAAAFVLGQVLKNYSLAVEYGV
jgi:hypothetical protein